MRDVTTKWYIRITSETHDPSGRRRRFNRLVPSDERATEWIEEHLPAVFYGCPVHLLTPIHHNVGVVDPDTRKLRWTA